MAHDPLFVPKLNAVPSSDLLAYPYQRKVVNFNSRYAGKPSNTGTSGGATGLLDESANNRPSKISKVRALSAPSTRKNKVQLLTDDIAGNSGTQRNKSSNNSSNNNNSNNDNGNGHTDGILKRDIVSAQPSQSRRSKAVNAASCNNSSVDAASQDQYNLMSERAQFDFDNAQSDSSMSFQNTYPYRADGGGDGTFTAMRMSAVGDEINLVDDDYMDTTLSWLIDKERNHFLNDGDGQPFLMSVGSVKRLQPTKNIYEDKVEEKCSSQQEQQQHPANLLIITEPVAEQVTARQSSGQGGGGLTRQKSSPSHEDRRLKSTGSNSNFIKPWGSNPVPVTEEMLASPYLTHLNFTGGAGTGTKDNKEKKDNKNNKGGRDEEAEARPTTAATDIINSRALRYTAGGGSAPGTPAAQSTPDVTYGSVNGVKKYMMPAYDGPLPISLLDGVSTNNYHPDRWMQRNQQEELVAATPGGEGEDRVISPASVTTAPPVPAWETTQARAARATSAKSTTLSEKQVAHILDKELHHRPDMHTTDTGLNSGTNFQDMDHGYGYSNERCNEGHNKMMIAQSLSQPMLRGTATSKAKLTKFKEQVNIMNSSVVTVESLFLNSLVKHKQHESAERATSSSFMAASTPIVRQEVGSSLRGIDRLLAQPGRMPPVRPPTGNNNNISTKNNRLLVPSSSNGGEGYGDGERNDLQQGPEVPPASHIDTHSDPLYRILREETERQQWRQQGQRQGISQLQHSHKKKPTSSVTPALSRPSSAAGGNNKMKKKTKRPSSSSSYMPSATKLPASRQSFLESEEFLTVTVSDLKSLLSFMSLPSEAWISMKITYFLIAAFHESVIMCAPSYRRALQTDRIWELLETHIRTVGLTSFTAEKEFSWVYLQELIGLPHMLVKVLSVIEHGLDNSSERRTYQAFVDDGDDSNNNINFNSELFPHLCSLESIAALRQLVEKGGASTLYDASSLIGVSPAVAKLCAWSKRIIALLYADALAKVRATKSIDRLSPVHMESTTQQMQQEHFHGNSSLSIDQNEKSSYPKNEQRPPITKPAPPSGFLSIYAAAVCEFPRAQRWHRQQAQRRQQNKPVAELMVDNSEHLRSALSLAKPTDQLSLLLLVKNMPPPPHPPSIQQQYTAVVECYEKQLRYVSLSPLHKVTPLVSHIPSNSALMMAGAGEPEHTLGGSTSNYNNSNNHSHIYGFDAHQGQGVSISGSWNPDQHHHHHQQSQERDLRADDDDDNDEGNDVVDVSSSSNVVEIHSFANMKFTDEEESVGGQRFMQPWRLGTTDSTDISYLLYSFGLELHPAVAHVVSIAALHRGPHATSSLAYVSKTNVPPRPEPPLLIVSMTPNGALPTLLQPLSSTDNNVEFGSSGGGGGGVMATTTEYDGSTVFGGNISRDAVVRGMAEIGGSQQLSFSLILASVKPHGGDIGATSDGQSLPTKYGLGQGQVQQDHQVLLPPLPFPNPPQYPVFAPSVPSTDFSALPKKFMVFVKDSDNSWAAFQMARRLAKPSDSIVVVHMPVLCMTQVTAADLHAPNVPTYLSRRRYEHALQHCKVTAQHLTEKYKAEGYNLYVTEPAQYMEEALHVYSAHSDLTAFESIAFSARKRFGVDRRTNDSFFLANRRTCSVAAKMLEVTSQFSPSYILLGSDCNDIASAVAGPNNQLHLLSVNQELRFEPHLQAYLSAVATCRAEDAAQNSHSNTFLTASDKYAAQGSFTDHRTTIGEERQQQQQSPLQNICSVPSADDGDMYDEESFEQLDGGTVSVTKPPPSMGQENFPGAIKNQEQQKQKQQHQDQETGAGADGSSWMLSNDADVLFDWDEVGESFVDFAKNRVPIVEALLHTLSTANCKAPTMTNNANGNTSDFSELSVILCNRY